MSDDQHRGTTANGHSGSVRAGVGPNGTVGHLIRETADGMGHLVIQHIKLAQLEIMAGIRTFASRGALILICLVLMLIGYVLCLTGLCILLGHHRALAVPFLALGGLHIAGAAIGILVAVARLRRTSLMPTTSSEIGQSATMLMAAAHDSGRAARDTRAALEQVNGR